ncbi:PaaI family thioesterase [Roseibium sediminicola]|uniref:PaaI family thioesterase n=1 Tax=Roseibium sediminicola TaxID=2933272 RepID=A0ABT0GRN0_9HYPH|nr:PaaI family thioesterase [Roseibium sp. CAU 1639]MCK7612092.1 PaaI family thioesterase [Roseibium sp. CAU 1639]
MQPVMKGDEIMDLLDEVFPQIHAGGRVYAIDSVLPGEAAVRLSANELHLRPGGTVSGPSMMALADLAAYVVILAHIGPEALAVTTNLNINFLRKPEPGDLIATCRLLKLGKRLAVVDCGIAGEGQEDLVAHATATYSVPPR